MASSSNCALVVSQSSGPELATAIEVARAAAVAEAGGSGVGAHVAVLPEDSDDPDDVNGPVNTAALTHLFEAEVLGYRGWRWAVTVAHGGADTEVTVSEVVLLPGPDALIAPTWLPWQYRVQAGDLGVGDLLLTEKADARLVPGYLASDDDAVEEVATEVGLGRVRVMSRTGRYDAADRWQAGSYGPASDMAASAPDHCGTCGFYLPVAGSLRAAFGVCGNEFSPADGHVVHVQYGCGAHSEVELDISSPVPVADLVYDDTTLDVERTPAHSAGPVESDSGPVLAAEPTAGSALAAGPVPGGDPVVGL